MGCADDVLPGAVCASAAARTGAAAVTAAEAAASVGRAAWAPAWLKSCCSWGTDPIMPSKASIRGEMSMLAAAEEPTCTFTVLPCIQQAALQSLLNGTLPFKLHLHISYQILFTQRWGRDLTVMLEMHADSCRQVPRAQEVP